MHSDKKYIKIIKFNRIYRRNICKINMPYNNKLFYRNVQISLIVIFPDSSSLQE